MWTCELDKAALTERRERANAQRLQAFWPQYPTLTFTRRIGLRICFSSQFHISRLRAGIVHMAWTGEIQLAHKRGAIHCQLRQFEGKFTSLSQSVRRWLRRSCCVMSRLLAFMGRRDVCILRGTKKCIHLHLQSQFERIDGHPIVGAQRRSSQGYHPSHYVHVGMKKRYSRAIILPVCNSGSLPTYLVPISLTSSV